MTSPINSMWIHHTSVSLELTFVMETSNSTDVFNNCTSSISVDINDITIVFEVIVVIGVILLFLIVAVGGCH